MSANTTSLLDWALSTNNINTVNLINNAIGLLFSLLIFIKSYDFESCLASVREKRELKRKAKEKAKLLKFQKMLELARANPSIDLSKITLSEEHDSEEEKTPDAVMRVARKKQKREIV